MKSILSIITLSSIVLSSCSSYTINTYGGSEDDLYYSKSDARNDAPIFHEEVQVQDMSKANTSSYTEQDQQNTSGNYSNYNYTNDNQNGSTVNPNYATQQESYVDENGKTIINNYYGDVYDDEGGYYSTRIQRFHRPYGGFGYYSPAYCGFYNDPFWNSGWNIGFGYSYGFGPSWSIGYGWGIGMGYGFYDPFFDPWFNPYFSPYYGFGGWGNNAYNWGYRDGYWDGRNDNGYWNNGGFGRGGNRNTVIRGPRPSRGGTVSTAGGRTVPVREAVPSSSGNTENVRSLPPSRTLPTNAAPVNNTAESRPVPNTSPNGYVPPRLPNNSGTPVRSAETTTERNTSPVRVSSPQPVRVNPNFGGTRDNTKNNGRTSTSPTPIRVEPAPRRSESSSPRYNSPSRSSSPSSSPSRSGGSSGSSPAPASRPRPR
jgi:hypothetical protein